MPRMFDALDYECHLNDLAQYLIDAEQAKVFEPELIVEAHKNCGKHPVHKIGKSPNDRCHGKAAHSHMDRIAYAGNKKSIRLKEKESDMLEEYQHNAMCRELIKRDIDMLQSKLNIVKNNIEFYSNRYNKLNDYQCEAESEFRHFNASNYASIEDAMSEINSVMYDYNFYKEEKAEAFSQIVGYIKEESEMTKELEILLSEYNSYR